MPSGIRFSPPERSLAPSVAWVLVRAFGPADAPTEPCAGADRLRNARQLGLLSRIFARHDVATIAAELGTATTEELKPAHRGQVAHGLAIGLTQLQIANAARTQGIQFALLKFAALYARKLVTPASRAACDLDILVPPRDARALAHALMDRGYDCPPRHGPPHQPFVLKSPEGVIVELHVHLPYMQPSRSTSHAEFESLIQAGLLVPSDANDTTVMIPTLDFLAAHLIVHGIVQHGFEPRTYSGWRMISDLIDLGFAGDLALQSSVAHWTGNSVSVAELDALKKLTAALVAGQVAGTWTQGDGAASLLRHLVCVAIDERYRARVSFGRYKQALREQGPFGLLREITTFAIGLPDANLHKLYPNSEHGVTWLRLMRPLDFARRGLQQVVQSIKRSSK